MSTKRLALVTGGTGDIGTAIIKRLDPLYENVIALDVAGPEVSSPWLKALHANGFQHAGFRRMDVCDFDDCEAVIAALIKEFIK